MTERVTILQSLQPEHRIGENPTSDDLTPENLDRIAKAAEGSAARRRLPRSVVS